MVEWNKYIFGIINLMESDQEAMQRYHRTLKIAVKNDAQVMVMDTLVRIAELLITRGEKDRAVEMLTFALQYPMRHETRLKAVELFIDLEAEVCPRVILDAKTLAQELTLDDMLAAILDSD